MIRALLTLVLLAALTGCTFGLGDLGMAPPESLPGEDSEGTDDATQGPSDDEDQNDDLADDDSENDDVLDDDDDQPEDDVLDDDDVNDNDGDGYPESVDCNDDNAAVHPDALEISCDGVDNNCDGQFLPEDLDLDLDGYSPCLGDCDDTEASVGIHVPEVECDGIDNDCSGIDECDDNSTPDPGSICSTALSFGLVGSGPVFGLLDSGDPLYGGGYHYEAWSVTLSGSGGFTAELVSFDFDSYLEVYDASCDFVGADDDGLLFLGTDASYTYSGGSSGDVLYVIATTYGTGSTGAYALDIL